MIKYLYFSPQNDFRMRQRLSEPVCRVTSQPYLFSKEAKPIKTHGNDAQTWLSVCGVPR